MFKVNNKDIRTEVSDVPRELKSLNKLNIALISQQLLFKKIAIMAKGKMPRIRGAIFNTVVDAQDIGQRTLSLLE